MVPVTKVSLIKIKIYYQSHVFQYGNKLKKDALTIDI